MTFTYNSGEKGGTGMSSLVSDELIAPAGRVSDERDAIRPSVKKNSKRKNSQKK